MNLHSFNGLDCLALILKLSNDQYDFEPLLLATEELVFSNQEVYAWSATQLTQSFNDIYVFLAAFSVICRQHDFCDFVDNLTILMD